MVRDAFPPSWFRERYSMLQQQGAAAFHRAWGAAAPAGRQGLQTLKEVSRKTFDRLRTMPWQAIASRHWKLFLVIGAVLVVGIIWKVPQWQAASWEGQPGVEPKDLAKLENDARTTLIQGLGGLVLLIGLYFTLKNLQLTQDRQITERYTRAVEQLGSDKLEVRLGAIYALERIARDSERDHWPLMEILTAYIWERAPWPPQEKLSPPPSTIELNPPADIQAVLTVLGRRNRGFETKDQRLDLRGTNLRGANLFVADLERAIFTRANLERAHLAGAKLERAIFAEANLEQAFLEGASLQYAGLDRAHLEKARLLGVRLEDAFLWDACLSEADLRGAHLERTNLFNASLQGANLPDAYLNAAFLQSADLQGACLLRAHLEGADLTNANLQDATRLSIEQLATVKTLYRAKLDPHFIARIQQQYPHLLEEPQD